MRTASRRDARERFDEWAATYEGSLFWRLYFTPLHDMLERRVEGVPGASVLDLGSGTGDMLRRFEKRGAERLLGIDVSVGMLEVARGLAGDSSRIEYVNSSVESLPLADDEFDIALSCIAFHHFPDPEGALAEVRRVLRPGGRLYLCDLSDSGILGRSMLAFGRLKRSDEHYFNLESLARAVRGAGLQLLNAEHVRRFPPTMLLTARKGA